MIGSRPHQEDGICHPGLYIMPAIISQVSCILDALCNENCQGMDVLHAPAL